MYKMGLTMAEIWVDTRRHIQTAVSTGLDTNISYCKTQRYVWDEMRQ